MTFKEKLKAAWEHKKDIAEGFYNLYISNNQEIKEEAARRLAICKQNTCGLWDETGMSDRLVVKGKGGCMGCGCEGTLKVNCMQCYCTLGDDKPGDGKNMDKALWLAIITPEQATDINEIAYKKQFEKKD